MLCVPTVIASSASLSANDGVFSSSAVQLNQRWGYSIQASYGSSGGTNFVASSGFITGPQGTLFLRGSNDISLASTLPNMTWTQINGSTALVSGNGTTVWNSQFSNYRWAQMVFAPSTGGVGSSGIITAIAMTNGIQ